MNNEKIIDITPDNIYEIGLLCGSENQFKEGKMKKIDKAPPYFELLAKKFKEAPLPCFNSGWEERALIYGEGITVLYSDQCPIVDYAIKNIIEASEECNIEVKLHKIESHIEAQNSPSPYGTFNILIDGKFLTHRIFDKERYIEIFKSVQA